MFTYSGKSLELPDFGAKYPRDINRLFKKKSVYCLNLDTDKCNIDNKKAILTKAI